MTLQHHPEARLEVLQILEWYFAHKKSLAAEFNEEVKQAERNIVDFPDFWYPLDGSYRSYHSLIHDLDHPGIDRLTINLGLPGPLALAISHHPEARGLPILKRIMGSAMVQHQEEGTPGIPLDEAKGVFGNEISEIAFFRV